MSVVLAVELHLARLCWFEHTTAILLNRQVYFKMRIFITITWQLLVLNG